MTDRLEKLTNLINGEKTYKIFPKISVRHWQGHSSNRIWHKHYLQAQNIASIGDKIILQDTLVIQYKQFRLNNNFKQYREVSWLKKCFEMGIQKTPLQKFYKLSVCTQTYTIKFTAVILQLNWIEISLVYDKSHK